MARAKAKAAALHTRLDEIEDFDGLVEYLRDELDWPVSEEASWDSITYNWEASELGIKLDEPIEIAQLRPLRSDQPWGVFFLNFPQAKLPVTLMRRILRGLSKRKRASANPAERAVWDRHDLLFISAVGEAGDRRLSFAHFQERGEHDLPTLRVIAWDADDTVRRLSAVDATLRSKLEWRRAGELEEAWQARWRSAFTERPAEGVRTADELAKVLAALARRIRDRIKLILPVELKAKVGPLKTLYDAVKATLSRDLTPDAFADTYAQTIAYGLLSARITEVERLRAAAANPDRDPGRPLETLRPLTADAAGAAMPVTNPFLRDLFTQFLSAGGREREAGKDGAGLDFDELGVSEVVDFLNDLDDRLHAVLLDFDRNRTGEDPVIHLYEGFLKAYDAKLRQTRGVYYTPKPVVGFIVRSVDEVLRTEFGLKDGLADTITWGEFVAAHPETTMPAGVSADEAFVRVLDPATGTGTFLVAIIDLIHERLLTETWKGKSKAEKLRLWNEWVPRWLLPRLYGFELMMAPYAVAHMKIGLKLQDTGYDFKGTERGPDGKLRPARARLFLTNALEPAQDLDMQLSFMSEALAQEAKAANDAKANARFTVVVGNPPYAGHSSNNNLPWIVDQVGDYRRGFPELQKPGQGKWLQDDYVKFFRLAESVAARLHYGVLGMITNHSWLDNPTYKGMRIHIKDSYSNIRVIDLHGNVKKKEQAPDGLTDQNVFGTIAQGVAIVLGVREANAKANISRADIYGLESQKLAHLAEVDVSDLEFQQCSAELDPFPFTVGAEIGGDYSRFPKLTNVMDQNGDPAPGIVTTHDEFAVSFTKVDQREKVKCFVATTSEAAAREIFTLCSQNQWSYKAAKAELSQGKWSNLLKPLAYRPFDERWTVYNSHVAVHRRERMSRHMLQPFSLALLTTRQTKESWDALAVSGLAAHKSLSAYDISYVFPIWLEEDLNHGGVRSNLSPALIARLAKLTSLNFVAPTHGGQSLRRTRGDLTATFGARDVFDWIYAVLHSLSYRERYADFLKSDFARIPLPRDRKLFAGLVPLGTRLVALHLLDTAAAPDLDDPKPRFAGSGEARVEKGYPERKANGRVYINANRWFEPVPETVWEHWIGGYQPAQKWLKDRSAKGGKRPTPGRVLTDEDQLHCRRMIVALAETAKTMAKIDAVIAKHGGFPDAFKGMTD